MNEQSENTVLNQQISRNQSEPVVIAKDLPFIPIEEMFNTPEYDAYIDTVDVAHIQQLELYKEDVNRYGVPALGNLAVDRPTLATGTFDPLLQQNPSTVPGTPGGFKRTIADDYYGGKEKTAAGHNPIAPVVSSMRSNEFMRYYSHPKFADLGFSPYANNEEYYNNNSSIYDDAARSWDQFTGLVGTGFMSTYRSMADVFSGNPLAPDVTSATEMDDAMAIGSSSRGGAFGWANNFVLNSAYTVGMISSIAVEELVMAAAAAATALPTGGASVLGFGARTAANIKRLATGITKATAGGRAIKHSYDMVRQMKNIDAAKDMYNVMNGIGTGVTKVFLPQTVAAIKSLKTAKNTAQNIGNVAKKSNTFGAFYKDIREMNHGLSESKLEAGTTYNERIKDGIRIQKRKNNGLDVTPEQMVAIKDNADRAAFTSLMLNAPLIFLSNKIVFANAFGGFNKSFKRMMTDNMSSVSKRIIRSKSVRNAAGEFAEDVFQDVGTGFKGLVKRTKSLGVKGNTSKLAGASLRYFAANFAEGIQEVGQEAISAGTNHYYSNLMEDPLSGGIDLYKQSISSAVDSQLGAQGLETFMSGFLMGGLLQGPQKLVFQGGPAVYDIAKSKGWFGKEAKAAIVEQKQNQEKLITEVIKTYNEGANPLAKDPKSLFNEQKYKFLIQKQISGEKKNAAFNGDLFGFIDETDLAKFQQIHTILETGGAREYENYLKDILKLSDKDLLDTMPGNKDVKSGKYRESINHTINQIGIMEENYNADKDKNPNPNDPSQFEFGSREFQEASHKAMAWEHIRYLKMFTKDGFNRAVERYDSIKEGLASDPIFKGMAATDLTVLLSPEDINNELVILNTEIIGLTLDDASDKKLLKKKKSKFDALKGYLDIIEDPKNQTKNHSFDKRKKYINKLKGAFKTYVQLLADSNNSFVNEGAIDEVLKKMSDHNALKGRAKLYYRTIELLNNPKRFDEIYLRQAEINKSIFKNYSKINRASIAKYINVVNKNNLLNQLAAEGVEITPDPEQLRVFLETGNSSVLTKFYDADGEISALYNKPKFDLAMGIISVYDGIKENESEKADVDTKVDTEVNADVEEIIGDVEHIENIEPSTSDKYKELLLKLYNKYTRSEVDKNNIPLEYSKWLETTQAKNFRIAFNKLRQVWVANDMLLNENKPLTELEKLDDVKFIKWLLSDEGATNNYVDEILEKLEVNVRDITGQSEVLEKGDTHEGSSIVYTSKNFIVTKDHVLNADGTKGYVYAILEGKTKDEVSFELLDRYNEDLNSFNTLKEAQNLIAKFERETGVNESFEFAGETLNHGTIVYDADGVKHMVLNYSEDNPSEDGVKLIRSEDLTPTMKRDEKDAISINVIEREFAGEYTKQDVKTASKNLPESVSRLNVSEPITPYGIQYSNDPYVNGIDRYNTIVSTLSVKDMESLELVITLDRDPDADVKSKGNYKYKDQNIELEENTQIIKVRSKYKIGFRINESTPEGRALKTKVDGVLKNKAYDGITREDGIFAFINTDNFIFEDVNKKQIDPSNFTAKQINNLFRTPDHLKNKQTPKELAELANDNFATNSVLISRLDGLNLEYNGGETIMSFSDLSKDDLSKVISFRLTPGKTSYDNEGPSKMLSQIENKGSVDEFGNYLVYRLLISDGVRTKVPVTNLKGDARQALLKKVEADLREQNIYNELQGGSDAYKAVVLLPTGKYALVVVKSKALENVLEVKPKDIENVGNRADVLFENFIVKAKKVASQQKEGNKGLEKGTEELKELREFSKNENENAHYIFAAPGYNVSMQVSPWGRLELQLFKLGKKGDAGVGKVLTTRLTVKEIADSESTSSAMALLFDRFNKEGKVDDLKIKITKSSFRVDIAKDASANTLALGMTTQVIQKIQQPGRINLFADSGLKDAAKNLNAIAGVSKTTAGVVTPTENFTDAEGNAIPKGPALTTESTTQQSSEVEAIDILSTDKAKQVFEKGEKNGWDLSKILTELQIPKDQKQIILDNHTKNKISLNLFREGKEVGEHHDSTHYAPSEKYAKGFGGMSGDYTMYKKTIDVNPSKLFKVSEHLDSIGLKQQNGQAYRELDFTNNKENIDKLRKEGYEVIDATFINVDGDVAGEYIVFNKDANLRKDIITSLLAETNSTPTQQSSEEESALESVDVIKEYTNKEITSLLNTNDQEAIEDYLGDFVSSDIVDYEKGRVERLTYEYGIIDRVSASNGSKVSRLLDLSGKMHGRPLMDIALDTMEKFNKANFGKDGVYLENSDIADLLKDSLGKRVTAPTAATVSDVEASSATITTKTELSKINNELSALKDKLVEGLAKGDDLRALNGSVEYQKLKEARNEAQKKTNANKILPTFKNKDAEDISIFTAWAVRNLPSSISIKDIALLGNNLKAGGVRIGAFVLDMNDIAGGRTIAGTIYTGAKSPFRYHEAFHGVFRMLLSDAEINKYLKTAKKEVRAKLRAEGKNFKKELEKFRNSADTYTNMSESRLEQEYYEEYLADEFEKFKSDPRSTKTSSEVKSLFTRILDWITSVFTSYNKTELLTLFENIDAGKYRNSSSTVNQFTNQNGVTEANALLPYYNLEEKTDIKDVDGDVVTDSEGKAKTNIRNGFFYLDDNFANQMVQSMAATYLDRVTKNTDPTLLRSTILDDVLIDFYKLYDYEAPRYKDKGYEIIELLEDVSLAFTDYYDNIKSSVYDYLNVIDTQVEEDAYNEEYFEKESGLRGVDQWNTDASQIGGVQSTPKMIRAYIATTSITDQDFFGNEFLTVKEDEEGNVIKERLIVPVNFNEVYNGLLKSVKNIDDPKAMLQNMYFFGQQNIQTGAVVSKFLNDIGVSEDSLLSDEALPLELGDPFLFQSFVNTFENFRTGYLFTHRDPVSDKILMYSAANRDDINSQMDRWSQAWNQAHKKIKANKDFKNSMESFLDRFQSDLPVVNELDNTISIDGGKITDEKLTIDSENYSKDLFKYTGIKLSGQLISFSLIKNIEGKDLTLRQKALVNANKNENPISRTDITVMLELIQGKGLLFDDGSSGMNSRLKRLAIQNGPFDESVGLSTFRNAEGELVYAHQKPTFHLKQMHKLNSPAYLEGLKEDEYLENNHLLNNEAFIKMSVDGMHKVSRIAGTAVGTINDKKEGINDSISNVSSRVSYGSMSPKEFALTFINSYTALVNTRSGKVEKVEYSVETKDGTEVKESALAPSLIRVMESSDTGDTANMPVIKAVEYVKGNSGKVKITNEVLDVFKNRIETEYNRILKERAERTERGAGILGNGTKIGFNINETDRAYKLHTNASLLKVETKEALENIANSDGISFDEALIKLDMNESKFKAELNTVLDSTYADFIYELGSINALNGLSNIIKNGYESDASFENAEELLNLKNDQNYNLKQIFFNDWINTTSLNEILLGDQAITLKNSIDAVKRAKAQNAATSNIHNSIIAPKYGINHVLDNVSAYVIEEPIGKSSITNKDIESADAQLYMTTKGFRYSEFGYGMLTPMQAVLLDKLENDGQRFIDDSKYQDPNDFKTRDRITEEDVFGKNGYASNGAMMNSRKHVYFDGTTFIKMSTHVLIPSYTSNNIETDPLMPPVWVAKENRVALHNLRVKLERQEQENDTISIAAPLSAFKMLKQNVTSLSELNDENEFLQDATMLDAKSFGLQVANPSNKMEVIDATQIKSLVTSEQDHSTVVKGLKNSDGTSMNIGQVISEYNKAISRRVTLKFKNKRNLIFTFEGAMQELDLSQKSGKMTSNLTAFLNFAQSGLKASQSSSNLLEFFSTKNGEQKYNLNNPITINKFETLFLAYLSKGVLSEKIPGHTLTLVSDFGSKIYRKVFSVETSEHGEVIPLRSEVTRDNVWSRLKNKPEVRELDDLTNDNIPAEGVYVLDRLRSGLMEFDSNGEPTGQRYIESMAPAHHAEVMQYIENTNQPIPDVISKMFAIRIPSQDNHSTMNVKLVDFLPAIYGSVGMFARELVEISGADFDVDKVFAQIKEWYRKNGKFVEYGKATTEDAQYEEYINYVNLKINKKGSAYSDALSLNVDYNQAASIESSLTNAEHKEATKKGMLTKDGVIALQMLDLPITKEQYLIYKEEYGEPYAAPYNNQTLDYKYALMGNDAVASIVDGKPAISYTPASLDILEDVLSELMDPISGLELFKERGKEGDTSVDSLLDKIKAFKANKGAAIGAIVSPNTNLSLLTEYGIDITSSKFKIKLNGITYDTFEHLNERLPGSKLGARKQDIISSLVTMATDDAKERLVYKLGLNREALGLVGNLTALSVPIKTSILLINNPVIQDIYNVSLTKEKKSDPGTTGLVRSEIRRLTNVLKKGDENKKIFLKPVSDILLRSFIKNPAPNFNKKNKDKSDLKIEDDYNLGLLSILTMFSKGIAIKSFTGNMNAISDLSNGLGKDLSGLREKRKQLDDVFDPDAMMDLTPIYRGDSWQSTYLSIFEQIESNILPEVFLSQSRSFLYIFDSILDSVDTNSIESSEIEAKVSRDLLSYITVKAYMHNNGTGDSASIATLNNNLIYPSNTGESIVDLSERLLETKVGKNNFFLKSFALSLRADNPSNKSGLNLLMANTFMSLNAEQKIDLQTSFAKIYGTLSTRNDALSIINYIMVKDGLQLTHGSLLEAISPFIMSSYLDHINTANISLRDGGDAVMIDSFGATLEQMKNEFTDGYLSSNVSKSIIKGFTTDLTSGLPRGVTRENDTVTISYVNVPALDKNLFIKVSDQDINGNVLQTVYKRDDVGVDKIKSTTDTPKNTTKQSSETIVPGIEVKRGNITKAEQIELFNILKPFIEKQGAKTNKGKAANVMIGLGLRWDYKSNNRDYKAVEINNIITPSSKTKYGYYEVSINGEKLGSINPRIKELMSKATGVDATNYDGAIINLYSKDTFISSHQDVDEAADAEKYPVLVANIGGDGNISVERVGVDKPVKLNAGDSYVFGVDGKNRKVWHRTYAAGTNGFLPAITTEIDNKTYAEGSYRISITLRRVKNLESGMPTSPEITNLTKSTSFERSDLSYASVKPKEFSVPAMKGLDHSEYSIKGYKINIDGHSNSNLIATKFSPSGESKGGSKNKKWKVIDTVTGKSFPEPSGFFGTGWGIKKEILDNLAESLHEYSKRNESINVLKSIGFNISTNEPSVAEVVSERKYTPDNIKSLESNQVFVFGANTVGGHGGGTAGIAQRGKASSNYTALKKGEKGLWSEYGVVDKLMEGTIGKSFGIVTKAASVSGTKLKIGSKRSVTLARINESVEALVKTAKENPKLEFLVTKFGTNMAGFSIKEMKSLLSDKELSDNIILPREFEYRNEANTTNNAPLSMDGVVGVYNKIETLGSNKQWAGGFLFGPRMTNKEVRKYTFDMQSNQDVAYDDVAYDVSYENFDDINAAFEDAFEHAKDIDIVMGDAQNASSIMLDDIDVSDYLPSEATVVVEDIDIFSEIKNMDDLYDLDKSLKSRYSDNLGFNIGGKYNKWTGMRGYAEVLVNSVFKNTVDEIEIKGHEFIHHLISNKYIDYNKNLEIKNVIDASLNALKGKINKNIYEDIVKDKNELFTYAFSNKSVSSILNETHFGKTENKKTLIERILEIVMGIVVKDESLLKKLSNIGQNLSVKENALKEGNITSLSTKINKPIAKSNRPVPNRATTEEQISYEEYEDFESENYMEGAALLQESLHAELELAAFNPKAEGVNGTLISYWDENIEGNSEIKAKFANNGIGTYDLMYDEFLSGIYPATADMTTEEVFIESLKCIL